MLVLSQADGDLRPVWSVIAAVPVFDKLCWFGLKVDAGPIQKHHVKSDIVFLFENAQ